jgi:MYXO-CTERM domain-containing protein
MSTKPDWKPVILTAVLALLVAAIAVLRRRPAPRLVIN